MRNAVNMVLVRYGSKILHIDTVSENIDEYDDTVEM